MAMLQGLMEKMSAAFQSFRNKGKLTEADVKAGMRQIKLALLEADVNFKVVKEFVARVSERAVGQEVLESLVPAQQVVKIVREELIEIMGAENEKEAQIIQSEFFHGTMMEKIPHHERGKQNERIVF